MAANNIQVLLRFLTQDAKLPLATAISKVPELQRLNLDSAEAISKAKLPELNQIFTDEKVAKQTLNAAKRISKKRSNGELDPSPVAKRARKDPFEVAGAIPANEAEKSLELVSSTLPDIDLVEKVFITNRAPLVLAFAATLVKYTMPEQPPSSRLSLAQAVVSMGSQSKAKYIGLRTGPTAEDEGWAEGQPTVKVMNRQISVLKRWGYDWTPPSDPAVKQEAEGHPVKTEGGIKTEQPEATNVSLHGLAEQAALWAIDLDQLKKLNGPVTFSATASSDSSNLPVYSPKAARAYLYRSFDSVPEQNEQAAAGSAEKASKKSGAAAAAEREQNVSHLLRALDLLYQSWTEHLSADELDRRAWQWYVAVRPDVENGIAGWGAKGELKLQDILNLRRKA